MATLRGLTILILVFSILSCQSAENKDKGMNVNAAVNDSLKSKQHKAIVLEVIQVTKYTYLRVKENEEELWMAVPSIDVNVGETIFYENGMLMTDFESKELKRTFDKILFVDKVFKETISINPGDTSKVADPHAAMISGDSKNEVLPAMGSAKDTIKRVLKMEPVQNGLTIADVLKNPKNYEAKTVKIRGKITKYTPGVMGKNWIHIQDGTEFKGKFELVITTDGELKVGETATFSGLITLNKDFGYGYFYEVLMMDAKVVGQ